MAGPSGHPTAVCTCFGAGIWGRQGPGFIVGWVCCEWRRQHWCLQSLTIPQQQWGPLAQGLSLVTCEGKPANPHVQSQRPSATRTPSLLLKHTDTPGQAWCMAGL